MHQALIQKKGFTLTELLIVIVILGILASLVIPRLLPQTERARAAEAINMIGQIRRGEDNFHLRAQTHLGLTLASSNTMWERIGMENPNVDPNRHFSYQVLGADPTEYTVTATRLQGQFADSTITMIVDNGLISWTGTNPFKPKDS